MTAASVAASALSLLSYRRNLVLTAKHVLVQVLITELALRVVLPTELMSMIAADLNMSPSEIHAAIKRLQQARLLHGPEMQEKPNLSALEEFLLHGVKYAFPAEHGQLTRGLPTSFAAPPLKDEIASGDELPPVWPWRDGETRGIALEPLYRTAPAAAVRDPILYELLALVDAIRDGRARERKIAEKALISRLRTENVKTQS